MVDKPFLGDQVAVIIGDELADGLPIQGRYITEVTVPEVLRLFLQKNKEYGDTQDHLGIKGQYAELWRKIGKLKRFMWEDNETQFEPIEEIISDLIGHCLLTLYMIDQKESGEVEMAQAYRDVSDKNAVELIKFAAWTNHYFDPKAFLANPEHFLNLAHQAMEGK